MSKKVIIIGGGIGGLGTALLLAKKGYQVSLYEKNAHLGGRANIFRAEGFTFDMGPSWYMMPDVFEEFFSLLGENINDYLSLERLSPSYRVFLEDSGTHYDFFSDREKNAKVFESLEPGSSKVLDLYLKKAEYQYSIARREFMYKNYDSFFDFFNRRVLSEGRKLPLFQKMNSYVNAHFKNEILRKVMQFQTVLLGTSPYDTPGIYSLMNYVDFVQGVHYPKGGIYSLIEALVAVAKKNGVHLYPNTPVKRIIIQDGIAVGVELGSGEVVRGDIIVSNADYHHTEMELLPEGLRVHSNKYWEKQILAPSAFIMYLGVEGKIPTLAHHNLLFSNDWQKNFRQIFHTPEWPGSPSVYVSAPSRTDDTVAPSGKENLFVLVPIGSGLSYTDEELALYEDKIINLISHSMKVENLKDRIVYKRTYCVKDFAKDFNSFKGTALGPAHTLSQTAFFRLNNVSKKVKNLYFTGAYTNPGIGMPICLISAQLVYKRILGINDPAPLTTL